MKFSIFKNFNFCQFFRKSKTRSIIHQMNPKSAQINQELFTILKNAFRSQFKAPEPSREPVVGAHPRLTGGRTAIKMKVSRGKKRRKKPFAKRIRELNCARRARQRVGRSRKIFFVFFIFPCFLKGKFEKKFEIFNF